MKLSRDEFEKLALAQIDAVDRIARALAASAAEADDLVQETYLRAIRSAASFDLQPFGIRPWLLKILHNVHKSRSAREQRQPAAVESETLLRVPGRPQEGNGPFTFDGLDEELKRALDQLPPDLRAVLILWAVEELKYQEIADVLEIPIGTVMSRLHRARQRLSERLEGFARRSGIPRKTEQL